MIQALGLLFPLLLVGVPPADLARLSASIDEVVSTPGFENGHWGLLVVDAQTGEVLYEKNSEQMFCPASVTKLFSGSAALDALGADHRFQTALRRKGEVGPDGKLAGDLILVASGDLCLGGRTAPDGTLLFENNDHSYARGALDAKLVAADPLAGLDHLAREVKAAGIKSIAGDVLVDDRLFERAASSGSGPRRVGPIVVNDNVIDIVVQPAEVVGEPARVRALPASSYATIDAQLTTVESGRKATIEVETLGPRRVVVRGVVPLGHPEIVKIAEVDDPASFARSLLIERLRAQGVDVSASPLADNDATKLPGRPEVAALPQVAEYTSPPFREYLKIMMKVSQNLHASTYPLLLAAKHGETTLAEGLKRQGAFLTALGIPAREVSFGGGAGGSRADLVTPRATVELLRALRSRPDFSVFESSLPVLGRDGTSAEHVAPESRVRGHVRAKTGTYWDDNGLTGRSVMISKALAGYMDTESGRPLCFAFFVNNLSQDVPEGETRVSSKAAGRLLGRLCEVVYENAPAREAR